MWIPLDPNPIFNDQVGSGPCAHIKFWTKIPLTGYSEPLVPVAIYFLAEIYLLDAWHKIYDSSVLKVHSYQLSAPNCKQTVDKTDWLSWALLFSPVRLASSRALSPYGIMEYFQILVSCMMYRLAKSWNFVVCGKSSSSLIFRTSCHTRGEMIDDGPMSSEIREQNWSLIRIRVLRRGFVSSFFHPRTRSKTFLQSPSKSAPTILVYQVDLIFF